MGHGFFHRQRFPGQRGFFHQQVLHAEQAQVGWHLVAGCQQHDVAGDQVFGVDFVAFAVAQHHRLRRKHVADGVQRILCLAFLDEADDHVDQHGGEDHRGVDPMAEQRGDDGGHQHQIEQHVMELVEQAQQWPPALWRRQAIGAMLLQAPLCLVLAETAGAAVLHFQGVLCSQGVPGVVGIF